ncbi:unnamed protein product [Notodromas monacha]|uniref:Uncharacterized protein n=1 Tax=Notodromas monacha TaxID=399045 RepID=A0A7R9GBR4_9CRUS|nr:unnamed protein product [Notodromas monacha]CAG0915262.1 unnamed protein product [Notodromas monacha]
MLVTKELKEPKDMRSLKKYASVVEKTNTASEFSFPQTCAFPSLPAAYTAISDAADQREHCSSSGSG